MYKCTCIAFKDTVKVPQWGISCQRINAWIYTSLHVLFYITIHLYVQCTPGITSLLWRTYSAYSYKISKNHHNAYTLKERVQGDANDKIYHRWFVDRFSLITYWHKDSGQFLLRYNELFLWLMVIEAVSLIISVVTTCREIHPAVVTGDMSRLQTQIIYLL